MPTWPQSHVLVKTTVIYIDDLDIRYDLLDISLIGHARLYCIFTEVLHEMMQAW